MDYMHASIGLRVEHMAASRPQRSKPAALDKIVDEQTKEFIDLCLQHVSETRPTAEQVPNKSYAHCGDLLTHLILTPMQPS